jgi:mono/diheme cytochrome c family protein
MRFLAGIVTGIAAVGASVLFVIATGAFPIGATVPVGKIEKRLASFAVDRAVARRAPRRENPVTATPETLAKALVHYREMCVTCHGAGAVDPSAIGEGLNPPAPDLTQPSVQKRTDGELFWLVQNGIRMTGMPAFGPTHSEDDIWALVAFLRHLPELTTEEEAALEAARER